MSTGSVCWVPDDASRTSRQSAARVHIAGYAPAQRQGSALHPCLIPSTSCRGSSGHKAVIGRAEASCKFHWQRSRARLGGAANILGREVVGLRAAARVTPRNFLVHSGEVVQAAYMPALQACVQLNPKLVDYAKACRPNCSNISLCCDLGNSFKRSNSN